HTDYSRILRELKVNRVAEGMITKVDDLTRLLDGVVNAEFRVAEEAQREFQKSLEGKKMDSALRKDAREKLDLLIAKIEEIIGRMGELTTINNLITTLREIEVKQRDNVTLLIYLRRR